MNLTQYNQKRDELSTLLQHVVDALDTVDKKYEQLDMSSLTNAKIDIATIRKKVYEDFYKIVLVAKFQGGKSTSFNAITGGTCISPMGNGSVKCSASLVAAKSVVDSADEGVTVCMRSIPELTELLAVGAFPGVDLTSEESRAEGWAVWQAKFELWKENAQVFETDDERDMFFVAGFILEFFNHPVIQEYLQRKSFEITTEDIGKFSKFPDDYLIRYSNKGPEGFDAEEAVYAFVSRVDARVQSRDMAKIGASFVDAPGLFANSYDTRVTLAELADASAVWYLLGAKQPGSEELKSIKECWELCKGRVFFSSNVIDNKVARPTWIDKVLPHIRQCVTNAIGEVDVKPYHALLALLYIQGEYFVEYGQWADESVKSFLINNCEKIGVPAPADLPVEQCWKISVKIALNGLYPFGLPEYDSLPDPLSAEGLSIIRRESNWDGTVEAIREFVVNSKSEAVLITDTSQKALELINNLKLLLQQREDDAKRNFEETNAAYVAAHEKLEQFETFANEYISKDLASSKDKMIAAGLYEDVFQGSAAEIAYRAAPLLAKKMGVFRITSAKLVQWGHKVGRFVANLFRDNPNNSPIENAHKVEVERIMKSTMETVLAAGMTYWIQRTKEGKNATFQEVIVSPSQTTFKLLQSKWNETCSDDAILKSLVPAKPTMPAVLMDGRFDSSSMTAFMDGLNLKDFLTFYMPCIWAWCIEPTIGCIVTVVAFTYKILRRLMNSDEMEEKIRDKIIDEMEICFNRKETRDATIAKLTPKISVFREAVISAVQKPFKEARARFNAAMESALSEHMRSAAHRAKVAQESKEIRENYVEGEQGLEQRLETYIKETKPLCLVSAAVDSSAGEDE